MSLHPLTITKLELFPLDLPIKDPFVVATGQMTTTESVFVRLTLKNGNTGYGEISPFYDISGESRESSTRAAKALAEYLLGKQVDRYRFLAHSMREISFSEPAARCGLETALLDAFSQSLAIPLWALWGGQNIRSQETDMTIPITDMKQTLTLTKQWYTLGFRIFKLKVGRNIEQDIQRLDRVNREHPDVQFIIDPNQGFTREEAVTFAEEAHRVKARILLYEQPIHRDDIDGQVELKRSIRIPLVADESVRTVGDLHTIIQRNAADYINIKIMKSGVIEAYDIAVTARSMGLGLMIGGMVETRLAMGCSYSLVLGLGGFETLDLDTPLLLSQDPIMGGYRYHGPQLTPWDHPGLGVSMEWATPALCIE